MYLSHALKPPCPFVIFKKDHAGVLHIKLCTVIENGSLSYKIIIHDVIYIINKLRQETI